VEDIKIEGEMDLLFNEPSENTGKAQYQGQFYSSEQNKRILEFRFDFRQQVHGTDDIVDADGNYLITDEIIDAYFGKGLGGGRAADAYNYANPDERIPANEIYIDGNNPGTASFGDEVYNLINSRKLAEARQAKKAIVLNDARNAALNQDINGAN